MKVIQTHLARPTEQGTRNLITWLPVDPRVKPGVLIVLNNDLEKEWQVVSQFTIDDLEGINIRWGLALPKSQRTER